MRRRSANEKRCPVGLCGSLNKKSVVLRSAAYASPRASNLTSVTFVIATNRPATRTTHVSTLACLAGVRAGRLTSSRVPRRRATPCRRRRRSTVAVHTAIVVATVVVATARRLVARLPHTSTTATLHTAAPVVAAAATRALKARPPPRLRVAPCSPRLSPLCLQRPAAPLRRRRRRRRPRRHRP